MNGLRRKLALIILAIISVTLAVIANFFPPVSANLQLYVLTYGMSFAAAMMVFLGVAMLIASTKSINIASGVLILISVLLVVAELFFAATLVGAASDLLPIEPTLGVAIIMIHIAGTISVPLACLSPMIVKLS